MMKGTLLSLLLAALSACFLLAPRPRVARAQELVENGGFEAGPSDWSPFGASPAGEGDGRSGQALGWSAGDFAGVYQVVPVTPGTTLRLTAWTRGRPSEGASQAWLRQRIGIDPAGGSDPASSTVHWSQPANFSGEWGQLAVEAEAAGEHVTLFLAAHPDRPLPPSAVSYDDVALAPVAFPMATVPAAPAPTVDPLLAGLVVGVGAAPGQQGFRASAPAAAGQPAGALAVAGLPVGAHVTGPSAAAPPVAGPPVGALTAGGLALVAAALVIYHLTHKRG